MLPSALVVKAARLQNFEVGSRLEWIETDGRGGYASSTAIGANTRRYHGLLVVALRPPTDRVVLLSRLEETLFTPDGARYDLAANVYPGVVHPEGRRDPAAAPGSSSSPSARRPLASCSSPGWRRRSSPPTAPATTSPRTSTPASFTRKGTGTWRSSASTPGRRGATASAPWR